MDWNKEFYYVECHTSFTYRYGKITTDVNEFNILYIKGNIYKMTIEHSDICTGWVKCQDDENYYGPGSRFMLDGKLTPWVQNYYTEFFLTPIQTEREKKLKEILYER